jgi:hypothetical protein
MDAGAGAPGAPSGPAESTFGAVYAAIERAGCKSSFCHGAGAGQLTLSTRDIAYDELLGANGMGALALGTNPGPAPENKPACAGTGVRRVTPGQPEMSLLYLKLADQSPCGDRMPLTGSAPELQFTPAELSTVNTWIMRGARHD